MADRHVYREVAALHSSNIEYGFLSSLGPRFLALLYEAIDQDANSVLLWTEVDGNVVGFVAGSLSMGSIYRQLLRRPVRLAWGVAPAIFSPAKFRKMLEIVLGPRSNFTSAPRAALLSIAIHADFRRQGLAENLYARLCTWFSQQHQKSFHIVVGNSLTSAQKFYVRQGAEVVGRIEVHKGQASTLFVQQCKP